MKERLASLISGGGTTMQEIVKACQSGEIPVDIACVVASSPKAGGIEKANQLGIPKENILVINPQDFRGDDGKVDQEGFGQQINKELKKRGVTVVTQNGWLPLTPEIVIDQFPNRFFNQHPGPVPDFGGNGMYGIRVHEARLRFVRETHRNFWTEVIGQRVHKKFDQGVVVKSARVPIYPNDTAETLQQRAVPVEHQVQIELLKDIAHDCVMEVAKNEDLIRPGEEHILFMAKQLAKQKYPTV